MFYRKPENGTIREMPDYSGARPRGVTGSGSLLAVCDWWARFNFYRGQARGIPSSTQRLDQGDAGGHTSAQDVHGSSLVGQCCALCSGHFQITHYPAFVAVGGEIK